MLQSSSVLTMYFLRPLIPPEGHTLYRYHPPQAYVAELDEAVFNQDPFMFPDQMVVVPSGATGLHLRTSLRIASTYGIDLSSEKVGNLELPITRLTSDCPRFWTSG